MPKQQLLSAYEAMLQNFENRDDSVLLPLKNAVKNVEDVMALLHRRDEYGRLPLLDAERKTELMELHLTLGRETEKLISSNLSENQKDAVRSLSAMAADNYRHLRSYRPSGTLQTLPELLDKARTYVVDARQGELVSTVKANQNVRQPLTFLTESGVELTGVFTPLKRTTVWQNWTDKLEKAANAAKGPNAAKIKNLMGNFMRRLDTPEAAVLLGLPANADHSARIGAFFLQARVNHKGEQRRDKTMKMIAKISNINPEGIPPVQNTPLGLQNVDRILTGSPFAAMVQAFEDDGTSIINNTIFARMHDGARLDNRNAAMSAVASLLGVSRLLAKSVPMKIINGEGEEQEGTFMMEAVGVDPKNVRPEDSNLGGWGSMMETDGRGLRSIADLQVLDYICGNTDRHANNVAYQFDKNGKFIGVQGFDNDCSFGTYVPQEGDKYTCHLTTVENMGVISASMYEQISKITPDMLKFSLRGFDLSEEELDAACTRMKQVRDAAEKNLDYYREREQKIRDGKTDEVEKPRSVVVGNRLRVIPNEEFKNLDVNSLSKDYNKSWYNKQGKSYDYADGNFFTKAVNAIKSLGSIFRRQDQQYRSLRTNFSLGSEDRGNPGAPRVEAAKARVLEEKLKQCTSFGRSSPEYQAMQTAVAAYTAFQDKLGQRIFDASENLRDKDLNALDPRKDKDLVFSRVVTFSDLQQMQELTNAMREAAQSYLTKKDPEHNKFSSYTQNRIEVARDLLSFCRNISDKEIETSTRNEREMLEKLQRGIGNEMEAEDKRKVPDAPEIEDKRRRKSTKAKPKNDKPTL